MAKCLSANQALVKLDIDGPKAPPVQTLVKKCDRAGVSIVWLSQCRSPGGKGWHLVLEVSPRPKSAMEVVALEAVLGSDLWREAVSIQRARSFPRCPKYMRDKWNVLYVPHCARQRRVRIGPQKRGRRYSLRRGNL